MGMAVVYGFWSENVFKEFDCHVRLVSGIVGSYSLLTLSRVYLASGDVLTHDVVRKKDGAIGHV